MLAYYVRRDQGAARIIQGKYVYFGPHSDKGRTLNYEDCTETIIALMKEMLIVVVLGAFNGLDRNKSSVLQNGWKKLSLNAQKMLKSLSQLDYSQ